MEITEHEVEITERVRYYGPCHHMRLISLWSVQLMGELHECLGSSILMREEGSSLLNG